MAPDLWTTLGGVFRLQPDAFAHALALKSVWLVAPAIVLLGGLSAAVGQSIVLFANRVKPARFAASLLTGAVLYAFGILQIAVTDPKSPHHYTHMILFIVLGVAALIGANFTRQKTV